MTMIRIVAPHFVAGVITRANGNRTAPIVKYMEWWSPSRILDYCNKKGWRYETHTDLKMTQNEKNQP